MGDDFVCAYLAQSPLRVTLRVGKNLNPVALAQTVLFRPQTTLTTHQVTRIYRVYGLFHSSQIPAAYTFIYLN